MCFSATASFVAAGVTGTLGLVSVCRVNAPRELPLAAMPLLFAVQQGLEGALWLNLPSATDATMSANLTLVYLLLAQVFWPIYAPICVLLIEPIPRRRRAMAGALAVGVGVAVYLLWGLVTRPHGASLVDDHIVYPTGERHRLAIGLAYLAATGAPMLLSSRRTVAILGAVLIVGAGVAYLFYWEAFVSVWCFFAAAASVVLLGHIEVARRERLRLAPA